MSGRICEEQEITLLCLMASRHLAPSVLCRGTLGSWGSQTGLVPVLSGLPEGNLGERPLWREPRPATLPVCNLFFLPHHEWTVSMGHCCRCQGTWPRWLEQRAPHEVWLREYEAFTQRAGLEPQPVWPGPSLKGAAPTKVPAPQPPLPVSPAAHSAQAFPGQPPPGPLGPPALTTVPQPPRAAHPCSQSTPLHLLLPACNPHSLSGTLPYILQDRTQMSPLP